MKDCASIFSTIYFENGFNLKNKLDQNEQASFDPDSDSDAEKDGFLSYGIDMLKRVGSILIKDLIPINVTTPDSKTLEFRLDVSNKSLFDLKCLIDERIQIHPSKQKLIYKSKE